MVHTTRCTRWYAPPDVGGRNDIIYYMYNVVSSTSVIQLISAHRQIGWMGRNDLIFYNIYNVVKWYTPLDVGGINDHISYMYNVFSSTSALNS